MKKIIVICCIMLPALTFAQLSKKDKKEIKNYTNNMCDCVDEVIQELHPAAVQFMTVLFMEGEDKATEYLLEYQSTAKESEIAAMNASFQEMSGEGFGNQIEDCDDKGEMDNKISRDIDNQVGEAHEYFLQMLDEGKSCFMMKNFYLMGISEE